MDLMSHKYHTIFQNVSINLDEIVKWLSCNGEITGIGPTTVFLSAATLFLYNELAVVVVLETNRNHMGVMEKMMIWCMLAGLLALMTHLWVGMMRFLQYYMDTIIRDSPKVVLELTTAGLLNSQTEILAVGPLLRFLRQQQHQIHIIMCWFLSLCYADYVKRRYCQRFNIPYLERWQSDIHDRATKSYHSILARVTSLVGAVHERLGRLSSGPMQHESPYNSDDTYMHSCREPPSPTSTYDSCNTCKFSKDTAARSTIQNHVTVISERSSCCEIYRPGSNEKSIQMNKSYSDQTIHASTDLLKRLEKTTVAIENLKKYIQNSRCTCTHSRTLANNFPQKALQILQRF